MYSNSNNAFGPGSVLRIIIFGVLYKCKYCYFLKKRSQ